MCTYNLDFIMRKDPVSGRIWKEIAELERELEKVKTSAENRSLADPRKFIEKIYSQRVISKISELERSYFFD